MLEEFGSIGYVPNIDRSLSTARSRGISINIVIQTLAQLQETYEDNMTSIILAGCATWILLGCNDKMSAELLEWRSGTATVEVKTTQHDAIEPAYRLTHRNSTGDGQRAIFTSNDIIKTQARNEALLIFQQLDPLKAKAFPIFQHHEFRANRMPEVSAESLIPLTNVKAKEIFRKWEAQRVKSFQAWLAFGGNPLREYTGFPPEKKGIMSNQDLPDSLEHLLRPALGLLPESRLSSHTVQVRSPATASCIGKWSERRSRIRQHLPKAAPAMPQGTGENRFRPVNHPCLSAVPKRVSLPNRQKTG